jgi:hypothetical protein
LHSLSVVEAIRPDVKPQIEKARRGGRRQMALFLMRTVRAFTLDAHHYKPGDSVTVPSLAVANNLPWRGLATPAAPVRGDVVTRVEQVQH